MKFGLEIDVNTRLYIYYNINKITVNNKGNGMKLTEFLKESIEARIHKKLIKALDKAGVEYEEAYHKRYKHYIAVKDYTICSGCFLTDEYNVFWGKTGVYSTSKVDNVIDKITSFNIDLKSGLRD